MSSQVVWSSEGSSARGGGDPLALEFKATADVALKNLQLLKRAPFSDVNFALLQKKIDTAQVIITDQSLDVSKDGFTQNSAAENQPENNLIIVNRESYTVLAATVQQALALHEFLSLMGIESTGNYPISGKFLSVYTGGTEASSEQAISSASNSVEIQPPCNEPDSDAATLFAMIADSQISAAAIQSFIQTHAVGWDALNDQCETTVAAAIEQKRDDVFQTLYEHYLPDPSVLMPNPMGNGPIGILFSGVEVSDSIYSYVLKYGDPQALQILKSEANAHEQSLNLNVITRYGTGLTELMVAASTNSSVPMMQYLLSNGNLINAQTSMGITPLIAATSGANINAVVKFLISSQAQVNLTDNCGYSPLYLASEYATSADVINTLIENGANLNSGSAACVPEAGQTALMAAASNLESTAPLSALIQAGANINASDSKGVTALMTAASLFNVAGATLLINARADINAQSADGKTAFIIAASPFPLGVYLEPQQDNMVETLLNARADTTVKYNGETALEIAQKANAPASLIQLLSAGN
jgi:ankyrin repeat protein